MIEDAAGLQLRREDGVRLLPHDDQDVRLRDVGIEHRAQSERITCALQAPPRASGPKLWVMVA